MEIKTLTKKTVTSFTVFLLCFTLLYSCSANEIDFSTIMKDESANTDTVSLGQRYIAKYKDVVYFTDFNQLYQYNTEDNSVMKLPIDININPKGFAP